MSLRIHTLLVGDIVSALRLITRGVRSARSCERSTKEPDACADSSALRVASNSRAGKSPDGSADDRASYAGTLLLARGGLPTELVVGILSATRVVRPELIEALAGARHYSNARARRYSDTARQTQGGTDKHGSQVYRHGTPPITMLDAVALAPMARRIVPRRDGMHSIRGSSTSSRSAAAPLQFGRAPRIPVARLRQPLADSSTARNRDSTAVRSTNT